MRGLSLCLLLLPSLCFGKPAHANQLALLDAEAVRQSSIPLVVEPQLLPSSDQEGITELPTAGEMIPSGMIPSGAIASADESEMVPFSEAVDGAEKLEGLFTLYQDPEAGNLYAEIKPEQLDENYLCAITLESGIGQGGLYSGLPLQDFLFYFRRVNNKVHFVVRNVHFRADPGAPSQRSIDRSFSDSVLYSLDIKSIHPERGTLLIDLQPLLLSDLPGISAVLPWLLGSSYSLDQSKTYFSEAKAFPLNLEIEANYGFSGGEGEFSDLSTLPDSRAFDLRIHFSFSQLPQNNGYRPRLADDRIGYFLTAYQDLTSDRQREPFVRYINRWHLEKQDPNAPLSPPREPIVFWIENTVPVEYRDTVREGVLMWNQAFERAGFQNAIEVRQMPDDATWDPADVRYNTIRWFNSIDGAFAMGPSRVNPLTGQILDADIIIDDNFVRIMRQDFRVLMEQNQARVTSSLARSSASSFCHEQGRHQSPPQSSPNPNQARTMAHMEEVLRDHDICRSLGSNSQLAMGVMALSLFDNVSPTSEAMKEFIHQFLRETIAHEVGHTLGLRHNFRGSTMLTPEELQNPEITRTRGLVSSVMDYNAVNLAPQGIEQGEYFTSRVGPYDELAIEYGYTPLSATLPVAELPALRQIAQRTSEPSLTYATDEDTFAIDPSANLFDLSNDPLLYSQWQMDNAKAVWNQLDRHYPNRGDSYSELSFMFDIAFDYYFRFAIQATNYIGGQSFYRDHAGDPEGRLPFEAVPVTKQREALATLQTYVFSQDAFQFSPQLLSRLAPSRWDHWGNYAPIARLDYPIHDRVFFLQSVVLYDLLSSDRLSRLRDIELRVPADQTLTMPELFNTLQTSIWTEAVDSDQVTNISSLRRALQREHMNILISMVLRTEDVPEDARTLAWYELNQLKDALGTTLRRRGDDLDTYTRAHLEESHDRISKALEAQLQSQ